MIILQKQRTTLSVLRSPLYLFRLTGNAICGIIRHLLNATACTTRLRACKEACSVAVPAGRRFHGRSEPSLSTCRLPLDSQSVFSVGPNAQPRTCRCIISCITPQSVCLWTKGTHLPVLPAHAGLVKREPSQLFARYCCRCEHNPTIRSDAFAGKLQYDARRTQIEGVIRSTSAPYACSCYPTPKLKPSSIGNQSKMQELC